MGLLDGKVAVVTGAGRGIGRGIVLELAKEGAKVVVNDAGVETDGRGGSEDPAALVCKEIEQLGGEGVPNYDELVLVTRTSTLENHPDLLRRFVQALGRGYEAVRREPKAAVSSLLRATSGLNRRLQLASVQATLPAFFPRQHGKPWGWQDPGQWNAYGRWMLDHHLISDPNAVAGASTNELLAGQGI